MHEILATAMVLRAGKDRGGQILPDFIFRIHKQHISGTIPGKIQVPLCQNLCSLSYRLQILAPVMFFWVSDNGGLRFYLGFYLKYVVFESLMSSIGLNGFWLKRIENTQNYGSRFGSTYKSTNNITLVCRFVLIKIFQFVPYKHQPNVSWSHILEIWRF